MIHQIVFNKTTKSYSGFYRQMLWRSVSNSLNAKRQNKLVPQRPIAFISDRWWKLNADLPPQGLREKPFAIDWFNPGSAKTGNFGLMLMPCSSLFNIDFQTGFVFLQSPQKILVLFNDPCFFSLTCRNNDVIKNRMFLVQNLSCSYGKRTMTIPLASDVSVIHPGRIEHI